MSSKRISPERQPVSEPTLESRLAEIGRAQAFDAISSQSTDGSSASPTGDAAASAADCPPLPALVRHLDGIAPLGGTDAEHVLACPRCSARRRALTDSTQPAAPRRHDLLRRLQWLTTIAALLLFGVTLWLWTPLLERGPDLSLLESEPAVPSDGLPTDGELVRVAHVPSNVAAGPRVDLFTLSANEPRSVVVLVRGWERGCRCVQWQTPAVHSGGSQEIFRGTVQPGEDLMVELDVTDHPPIEQHLVVITARNPELLPESINDTEELFCCLERQTPSSDAEDVAESCLPNGVAVMTQPFTVD